MMSPPMTTPIVWPTNGYAAAAPAAFDGISFPITGPGKLSGVLVLKPAPTIRGSFGFTATPLIDLARPMVPLQLNSPIEAALIETISPPVVFEIRVAFPNDVTVLKG